MTANEDEAYAQCKTCNKRYRNKEAWKVEEWADLHEFSHTRHNVRIHYHDKLDQN